MTSQEPTKRPRAGLTIHPPSPNRYPPRLTTPINQIIPQIISPRKAPLPPSPTHSAHSNLSGLSAPDDKSRSRKSSFDTHRPNWDGPPGGIPPVPRKDERKSHGPFAGLQLPRSPRRRGGGGGGDYEQGVGMYDNKLVTSTLSQLPPIPPLSPTPTGTNSLSSLSPSLTAPSMLHKTSYATLGAPSRPILSAATSTAGVVVLPDGTALSRSTAEGEMIRTDVRSIKETLAHSSPSSPWSLLTIHVLPIFAGSPLKSSIEDLNHLCHSHIIATSQRTAASRLVAVLDSDLRDFVSSGMLTLKAKLETADDIDIIPRLADIWKFFWTQILSYLEGVFLPFSQMRDIPSASSSGTIINPLPVRQTILSGFLLNLLLPPLSRLLALMTQPDLLPPDAQPTITDLQQILQMTLVLSTQGKYSSFFPFNPALENERSDREVKENVQAMSKAVRWRIGYVNNPPRRDGSSTPGQKFSGMPKRTSLQRVSSLTQAGRHRRPGYRASHVFSSQVPIQTSMEGIHPSRQNSDFFQPEARWGRPRVDEEDDDDHTPGQSFAPSRQDSYGYGSTATTTAAPSAASTLTAGTWRAGGYGETERTPQAEFGRRTYSLRDPSGDAREEGIAGQMAQLRVGQRV